MRSIELGLAGIDLSMIPRNWRDYASRSGQAWKAARPVSLLLDRSPEQVPAIHEIAADANKGVGDLRFMPLLSRQVSWVVVLASPDARIVGYLPVDGFF